LFILNVSGVARLDLTLAESSIADAFEQRLQELPFGFEGQFVRQNDCPVPEEDARM
jgi:hypothetical protein